MYVWAAVKDPGGTEGVMTEVKQLRELGHEVQVIANGKAVELLADKENFFPAKSADDVLEAISTGKLRTPDVHITSMCSEGGVGRDLVPFLQSVGVRTIAFQDFYGARLWTVWADPQYRPDRIVTNDRVAAEIVKKAWPDFTDERIVVSGFPAMDKYAGYDAAAAEVKVREILGLEEKKPIVLFGGQLQQTGGMLADVVETLNELRRNVYFVARPHPRTPNNAPEEMAPWQGAMAKLKVGTPVFDFFGQISHPQPLIAAAKVVISMYSTILIEKACLRGDAIAMLYPDVFMKRLRAELQGVDEFPLVELNCCAKVTDRAELRSILLQSLEIGLGLEPAQDQHFKLDGKNAWRAAKAIEKLLQ